MEAWLGVVTRILEQLLESCLGPLNKSWILPLDNRIGTLFLIFVIFMFRPYRLLVVLDFLVF